MSARPLPLVLVSLLLSGPLTAAEKAVVWVNCGGSSTADKAAYISAARAAAERLFDVSAPDAVVCRALAPPKPIPIDFHLHLNASLIDQARTDFGVPQATVQETLLLVQLHHVIGLAQSRRGWIAVFRNGLPVTATTISLEPLAGSNGARLLVTSGLGASAPTLGLAEAAIPSRAFSTSAKSRVYGDAAIEAPLGFDD